MKNELAYAVGDMVKIESKIMSVDLHKESEGMSTSSGTMTGLVIGIDASIEKGLNGYETKGYIISVFIDEGLGLWDFGTKYWKIWKLYK